jgi:hypothetical protein
LAQAQGNDYAHTGQAAKNRYVKAQELAAHLWEAGVSAAQLDLWTDEEWARASRSAVGRSASDDTRLVVYGMMIVKAAWAAAHPAASGAARKVLSDEEAAAFVAPRRR